MDWTMTTPAGTAVRRRWTLDDDPRYVVEDRAGGRCAMLIDGRQVDDATTPATAMYILELRYEATVHAEAFELARLRLRQAEERITSRFPSAARDGQLASILSSLGDALGTGPEATDSDTVVRPAATEAYRQQVSPELAVTVDPSQCIVLEVSDGQGRVLRRIAVPHVGVLKQALAAAYDAQQLAIARAEQDRMDGLRERLAERRGKGS